MAGFDTIFELFTLLLGLAMAEVLGGFAMLLKLRGRRRAGVDPAAAQVHIGVLVPLLGAVILLDQSTFWLRMYDLREVLWLSSGSVVAVLVLIGAYYLLASLIVPDLHEVWPDFDAYYMAHRRTIIGGAIAIGLVVSIGEAVLPTPPGAAEAAARAGPWVDTVGTLSELAQLVGLVGALVTARPRLSAWLLGLVVAAQLAGAAATLATPGV
jgi:hypothetical protein